MRTSFLLLVCLVALAMWNGSALLSGVVAEEKAEREFVGAGKCKTCHKKPDVGEQYTLWEKTAHAGAYATLASDKAKSIAAEKGIDDPQKADACLKCHVTGHGAPAELLGTKYDITEGVGCESCHGPGGSYYKKSTMKAISSGEIDGATVGLIMPTEETCLGCHNEESPTFTPFDFDERFAKIAHPMPDELKAKYKGGGEAK